MSSLYFFIEIIWNNIVYILKFNSIFVLDHHCLAMITTGGPASPFNPSETSTTKSKENTNSLSVPPELLEKAEKTLVLL